VVVQFGFGQPACCAVAVGCEFGDVTLKDGLPF
jgi:hypothetical protein